METIENAFKTSYVPFLVFNIFFNVLKKNMKDIFCIYELSL